MRKNQTHRVYLVIGHIFALTAFGCNLVTILFSGQENPGNIPADIQPLEQNPPQPELEDPAPEPEPVEPEVETESESEGEQDGAGPITNVLARIDYGGLELFYDAQVILEIDPELIPWSAPEYTFEGYPAYMKYHMWMDYGMLEVVDIAGLRANSELSWNAITELSQILETRDFAGLDCIPEVPLDIGYTMCNHQEFNANVDFVDFRTGSGIRFVTVYAIQDYAPVTSETTRYVYQGISADGECYIKGTFRITHSIVPETGEMPPDAYTDMSGKVADEYFRAFKIVMEGEPEGFFPSLDYLDRIIESVATGICGGG